MENMEVLTDENEIKEESKVVTPAVETEPLFTEYVDFDTFSKSDFRVVKVKECTAVKKSKKLLHFVLDDGTGSDRIILSGIHAYYEPEELVGKTLVAITNLPPRAMMCIASGGQGSDEVISEAKAMELYLLEQGIPAEYIMAEEEAQTIPHLERSNHPGYRTHHCSNLSTIATVYHADAVSERIVMLVDGRTREE